MQIVCVRSQYRNTRNPLKEISVYVTGMNNDICSAEIPRLAGMYSTWLCVRVALDKVFKPGVRGLDLI